MIKGVHHSPVFGFKITVKQDKRPEILKIDEIKNLLYQAKAQVLEERYFQLFRDAFIGVLGG